MQITDTINEIFLKSHTSKHLMLNKESLKLLRYWFLVLRHLAELLPKDISELPFFRWEKLGFLTNNKSKP
jgi:hypothetical protein